MILGGKLIVALLLILLVTVLILAGLLALIFTITDKWGD